MPCRLRVISFGWSPQFVYRHFVNVGLASDDVVVFVVPKPLDEVSKTRFAEAMHEVEKFLEAVGYGSKPFVLEVEQDAEPVALLNTLLDFVSRFNCQEFVFDASGGMRIHSLALLILALNLSQKCNVEFYIGLESRQKLFKLPLPQIANLLRLTDSKMKMLRVVASLGEATMQDIAKALNKDVSYVRKTVRKLLGEGLLERVKSKPPKFKVTEMGMLTLKLYEITTKQF